MRVSLALSVLTFTQGGPWGTPPNPPGPECGLDQATSSRGMMTVGGPQPPVTALDVLDTHTHTDMKPLWNLEAASDPLPKGAGAGSAGLLGY